MKRPTQADLVASWNERHPVGTRVRFWKLVKRGEPSGEAFTATPAQMLGGHTAVVWLDHVSAGVSGCIALSHIEACT